jgi:glycosyltransferase involved in cell wall biosynthesis
MKKNDSTRKKRVLFLVPYPFDKAPSQRLKFEQYYSYFEQDGFEITKKPFISESFWKIVYKKGFWLRKVSYTVAGYLTRFALLFQLRKYDLVYIHLWVTPLGPPLFERLTCGLSKKVIYDIDDLIYIPKSEANKVVLGLKGKTKPFFLMKKADHVITCTPYLDQIARKYNQHTTDISSTIDTDKYIPKENYAIREGKLILGWSGSHSTSKFLLLLKPVFEQLKNENISFKLLVLGDASFQMEGIEVEALPWREDLEVATIKRFDIGLYPLPDEEWVYGKSGLKALQYMAAGVPVIATAIGANFRILESEKNGFLVKDHEGWLSTIRKLMEDESLRRQIGRRGVETVEKDFSVKANIKKYLHVLHEVMQ